MTRLALAAALCLGVSAYGAEGLQNGLSYCSHFDGSLDPAIALGSKDASGGDGFVDGVVGKALKVSEKPFKVFSAGNFTYASGSVSFWYRPDCLAKLKGENANIAPFKAVNFVLCYQIAKKTCFFMTGKAKAPVGFNWDYSVNSKEMVSSLQLRHPM